MKTLYRFWLLCLFALPAFNVLAGGIDSARMDIISMQAHCMSAHTECHSSGDKGHSIHANKTKACSGVVCGIESSIPYYLSTVLSAQDKSTVFVPTHPSEFVGIIITPPLRPPLST